MALTMRFGSQSLAIDPQLAPNSLSLRFGAQAHTIVRAPISIFTLSSDSSLASSAANVGVAFPMENRWHSIQDELTYHIVSVCCEKLTFWDSLVKYHDLGLLGSKLSCK
jgi:hypothetical protein